MKSSVALVTGASSGIGLELARLLASRHRDVVLTSRDQSRLQSAVDALQKEFPRATFHALHEDLGQPRAAQRLFNQLRERDLSPNVLISNAGLGVYGEFARSEPNDIAEMLHVNVLALTELSRLLLPDMLQRKRAGILHVGSVAGFCPGPLMSVYYASKAYVVSFSVALRAEVRAQGVSVSCLCPGPVKTRFQERAGLSASKLAQATMMDAGEVAREGLRGLQRNQAIIVPGRGNQLFALSGRLLPPTWVAARVLELQKRKD